MFPGLMALAVARVDETERGSVVGTTSAFLDLSFGLAPAVLGVVAGVTGYAAAFGLSAGVGALVGAATPRFARAVDTASRAPATTRPAGTGVPPAWSDRAGLRGGRRADGPRHRPGPRGDRPDGRPVRAGPGACRGRPRPDRRQPRPGGGQGQAHRRSERDATLARIDADRRPRARPDADLVIEAVFEDLDVKHGALARARRGRARRPRSSPRTRARSRSTAWPRPSRTSAAPRFVGMHFFSPVPVMPLIELIRGTRHDRRDRGRDPRASRPRSASRSSCRPIGPGSSSTGS